MDETPTTSQNNQPSIPNGYKFVSVKPISPILSTSSVLIPRQIRSYTINEKLEVLKYVKEHSINAASRQFNIDRKCIRQWARNEQDLLSLQASSSINQIKKRRSGAGRRVKYQIFDEDLAKWLKSELDSGKNPSRSQIQLKALEMAQSKGVDINKDFKASTGWLEKFLVRHDFRTKSLNLKFPNSLPILPYQRKIDPKTRKEAFPKFIESLREIKGYKQIYVAYKASILIDESGNLNLDEETSSPTDSDKLRITFILTVSSDGQKYIPFIILPRESSSSFVTFTLTQQLHLVWSEKDCEIDNEMVILYLQHVFDNTPVCKRIILWNELGCQLTDGLNILLRDKQLTNMLIPSNFEDFIQMLNSTLRERFTREIFEQHSQWRQNESISNGNLGPLSINLFLNWFVNAWKSISHLSIVNLFAGREITNLVGGVRTEC